MAINFPDGSETNTKTKFNKWKNSILSYLRTFINLKVFNILLIGGIWAWTVTWNVWCANTERFYKPSKLEGDPYYSWAALASIISHYWSSAATLVEDKKESSDDWEDAELKTVSYCVPVLDQ